jgi:hypothetical protein
MLWAALSDVPIASAAVISEVHYNPPGEDPSLEFVEIANETATPEDLSGYWFETGIDFTFPPRTILPAYGLIVVCADSEAIRARYGIENAVGDFVGRLDSGGERIRLVNQSGVTVSTVRYRDQGQWPAAPDGTGHTLSLLDVHLDASEPESWTASSELGGTPGRANFGGEGGGFVDTVVVDRGAIWRYRKGTAAFSTPANAWREPDFDDSTWDTGPSGFGYGDDDDATVLADMSGAYLTVAIRHHFELDAADLESEGSWLLGVDYDDGVCAWINGTFVVGANCTADLGFGDTATNSREVGAEETYPIPGSLLREGENVVALIGHNFSSTSSDFSLLPRIIRRATFESGGPAGSSSIVANELYRGAPGTGWVEFYNRGAASVDLSGRSLTDDPDRVPAWSFPAGSIVAPGGFLVVDEISAGLDFQLSTVRVMIRERDGRVLSASVFARGVPEGFDPFTASEGRLPDGGELGWLGSTPTRGTSNRFPRETGIVINEIHYNPPAIPLDIERSEFIELLNRSTIAVDLSGFRFDSGIDYTFPNGTAIAPGGYVVLASQPEFVEAHHGLSGVLGPYVGRLSNAGENLRLIDRNGNIADELTYRDGGEWPRWSDGGGSSIELVDPRGENHRPAAWRDSDESEKAEWEEHSYRVTGYQPSGESELHLFLVERGICHIDDVTIQRNGAGANYISNPGFESTTNPWRIQGTHGRSRRITTDQATGNACLRLEATGKGDTSVNRIESDTTPAMTAGTYDVSLRARWIAGSSRIVSHGEFTAGSYGGRPGPATNLSGNSLGGQFRMTIPFDLGTPGRENSARALQRDTTGSDNGAPVIASVLHSPPSPVAGQSVTITCEVVDPDGVSAVRVRYRESSAVGAFSTVSLADDGRSDDGRSGDGVWGASIPATSAGRPVVFYVEAVDGLGAIATIPADAPLTTRVFLVQGPVSSRLDSYRVVLDSARRAELDSRELHSNDLLDGSFVFRDKSVHYHVGLRYRGSPWGRPGRSSFRLRLPDDRPLIRGLRSMNLSSRGSSPNEGAGYFLVGRNGTIEKRAPTADYFYISTYINERAYGTQAMVQAVDGVYLEKWYGDLPGNRALKGVGRLQFNDGGGMLAWDGASFKSMGENPENYRGYYFHSVEQDLDEWEDMIELCRIMDRGVTNDATFDRNVDRVLDVEAFLRVLGPRILMAGWDALFVGNGHNGYLSQDGATGLWGTLPFDLDNEFGNPQPGLFPAGDTHTARMMSRPGPRRTYFRILSEYVDGYWSAAAAGPWLDQVSRDTSVGASGIKGYLTTSASWLRGQIATSVNVAFRIVTNGGQPIETDADQVILEGDASVDVATITLSVNDDEPELFSPTWTTPTRWRATLPLTRATQNFRFDGFDGSQSLVATASIRVTTNDPNSPFFESVLPNRGPSDGGTTVNITGDRFAIGLEVWFGGEKAPSVLVSNAVLAQVTTPPAPANLAADGFVDIELVLGEARRFVPRAFLYEGPPPNVFVRGDSNRDGAIDLSDPIATLAHLFSGRLAICQDAADVDDDGSISISDAISALRFLFLEGTPPAAPFPLRGRDVTDDALGCDS